MPNKTVLIVGTLDTKGQEIAFLRDRIRERGCNVLVLDGSILGEPAFAADVPREVVAQAGGGELAAAIAGGKENAVALMMAGLQVVVRDLYDRGLIDGAIAITGGRGASMIAPALRTLPLGVPKMVVSTTATGRHRCGWLSGTTDMVMMHAVADMVGLNSITRPVLANAAAAIAGMVETGGEVRPPSPLPVAATMVGTTTPGVTIARQALESMGYEVITFHPSGSGGQTMERLIAEGFFRGILDLSVHDLTSEISEGFCDPGPDRLRMAARYGVPQVVAPGGTDYFPLGPRHTLSPEQLDRPYIQHSFLYTLVKPTQAEMVRLGHIMAERLNGPKSRTVVMVPLRGFSDVNREGRALWNPEGNAALLEVLRAELRPPIELMTLDLHMNDREFAEAAARTLNELMERHPPT